MTVLGNLVTYVLVWGAFLVVPAVVATVAYLDARHRAEGLTLDQLEAELLEGKGARGHG